jgi:hypothetical protein
MNEPQEELQMHRPSRPDPLSEPSPAAREAALHSCTAQNINGPLIAPCGSVQEPPGRPHSRCWALEGKVRRTCLSEGLSARLREDLGLWGQSACPDHQDPHI